LDTNLYFQPGSWVKRFTPPQERRIKVQRFSSLAIKLMESITKGNIAKQLTLDFESRFQRETLNPDRADVKLICNPVGYRSTVICIM